MHMDGIPSLSQGSLAILWNHVSSIQNNFRTSGLMLSARARCRRTLAQLGLTCCEDEETMRSLRHPEPLARDPLTVAGIAYDVNKKP